MLNRQFALGIAAYAAFLAFATQTGLGVNAGQQLIVALIFGGIFLSRWSLADEKRKAKAKTRAARPTLAKSLLGGIDARQKLNRLGIKVVGTTEGAYEVVLPKGWTLKGKGPFERIVTDENGITRLTEIIGEKEVYLIFSSEQPVPPEQLVAEVPVPLTLQDPIDRAVEGPTRRRPSRRNVR